MTGILVVFALVEGDPLLPSLYSGGFSQQPGAPIVQLVPPSVPLQDLRVFVLRFGLVEHLELSITRQGLTIREDASRQLMELCDSAVDAYTRGWMRYYEPVLVADDMSVMNFAFVELGELPPEPISDAIAIQTLSGMRPRPMVYRFNQHLVHRPRPVYIIGDGTIRLINMGVLNVAVSTGALGPLLDVLILEVGRAFGQDLAPLHDGMQFKLLYQDVPQDVRPVDDLRGLSMSQFRQHGFVFVDSDEAAEGFRVHPANPDLLILTSLYGPGRLKPEPTLLTNSSGTHSIP
jgi:hypothetical protein